MQVRTKPRKLRYIDAELLKVKFEQLKENLSVLNILNFLSHSVWIYFVYDTLLMALTGNVMVMGKITSKATLESNSAKCSDEHIFRFSIHCKSIGSVKFPLFFKLF